MQCFECLLEHGADISLKSNAGENPLDVARKHGKPHAISKAGKYTILWTQPECKVFLPMDMNIIIVYINYYCVYHLHTVGVFIYVYPKLPMPFSVL